MLDREWLQCLKVTQTSKDDIMSSLLTFLYITLTHSVENETTIVYIKMDLNVIKQISR